MQGASLKAAKFPRPHAVYQHARIIGESKRRFLRIAVREKQLPRPKSGKPQSSSVDEFLSRHTGQGVTEAKSSLRNEVVQSRKPGAKDEPVVRWYQQLYPWSKERRLSDPDSPFIDDEDAGEIKLLKKEIDRLDQELREMQEAPEGKTLIEPLLRELSPEDQQIIRDEIKRREVQEQQAKSAVAKYLPRLEIRWRLPAEQSSYLRTLNDTVRETAFKLDEYTSRRRLWMSYARCKAFLPPFLHLVPNETWLVLYKARALAAAKDDAHWANHLIILVDDMKVAGQPLQPHQIMLYIEALRFGGRHPKAVQEWQNLRKIVENDEHDSAEYELLGVRLFTSQGDLGRAEQIANKYLATGDKSESRILIPIMDTWIERQDEMGMKHAWALYLRLKLQLGPDMMMEDYDSVCLSFLHRKRPDLAIAVFKDMMLTGQETGQSSLEIYQRTLYLVDEIQHGAVDAPQVNKISLASMKFVPKRLQNKWFYAMWIKKLIGMDEADSAATVVELMYERGIAPDARHLNGIVGAWFRTRSDERKSQAEQMAWAMIHQRLRFVEIRKSVSPQTASLRTMPNNYTASRPEHSRRSIPSATIETFCLLLQYYTRRQRYDSIETLHRALERGKVAPNSYWMNHHLYMSLRQDRHDLVWQGYNSMTEGIIQPDLETFNCLWKSLQSHDKASATETHRSCVFPSARRIMHEQVAWLETRTESQRRNILADFTRDFYEQVIQCVAESFDFAGTIVALYIMRDAFGCYPSLTTNRNVVKQVARMTLRNFGETHRTSHRLRRQTQASNEAKIETALKLVQHERTRVLAAAGYDDFEQLDEEIRREERLYMMAEFLRSIIGRTALREHNIAAGIASAKSEMGMMDLNMKDPIPHTAK